MAINHLLREAKVDTEGDHTERCAGSDGREGLRLALAPLRMVARFAPRAPTGVSRRPDWPYGPTRRLVGTGLRQGPTKSMSIM